MTSKAVFKDAEWQQVQSAVYFAGAIVPCLEFGVVAMVREGKAILAVMEELRAQHKDHEFLRELFASTEMPDLGKQENPVAVMMEQIRQAHALMKAHASAEELAAFNAALNHMAEKVAGASGSGWFGFGEKISEKEKAYLADLKAVLS